VSQLLTRRVSLRTVPLLGGQRRRVLRLLVELLALGRADTPPMSAGTGVSIDPARQGWARQQSFVAKVSRELHTQRTLLRAAIEVAIRGLHTGDVDGRKLLGAVLMKCTQRNGPSKARSVLSSYLLSLVGRLSPRFELARVIALR
jgi:hypothetical protein